MKRVFLVFTAVLSLGFGTCVKAADATKAMPAIISYLLSDSGRFTRVSISATQGIVKDSKTNFWWQDEKYTDNEIFNESADTEGGKVRNWQHAIDYCNGLSYGGYSDWKLPNFDELMSIVDDSQPHGTAKIFPDFLYSYNGSFWTTQEDSNVALTVSFWSTWGGWEEKSRSRFVRCMRVGI